MKKNIPMFAIATLSMMLFGRCSGGPPSNLGVKDGKLPPCPKSPNCVSTQSSDRQHGIHALPYHGSRAETMTAILGVVNSMERTTIITQREGYLHVEYRTKMGFVDDVEFYLDDKSQSVHFRSASRIGYSDLGVNRKRMEEFSALYRALP
ncbi:MAG: DUF1499 domain-containing protein [Spirochaetaceae bacterium]|nr:MAG: DUF1499 domain-containing protein [Spirochaetaceae bacterium]